MGFFAEVDESIFVDVIGSKRTVYTNDPSKVSRTLLPDLPEKLKVANFKKGEAETEDHYNLQAHIDMVNSRANSIKKFSF